MTRYKKWASLTATTVIKKRLDFKISERIFISEIKTAGPEKIAKLDITVATEQR
mgnify:CR=1 FL=1